MKFMAFILLFLSTGALVAQGRPGPPPNDPWAYGPGPRNWDRSWNDRPMPRRGACFFKDINFRGDRFCVRGGDRLDQLPGNFGNRISSIQLFGGAEVTIFNDAGFRNGQQRLRGTVADLRSVPFRGGHTWNDRISSMIVR